MPEGAALSDRVLPGQRSPTWADAARLLAPELLPARYDPGHPHGGRPPCLTPVIDALWAGREALPSPWQHRLDEFLAGHDAPAGKMVSATAEGSRPPSVGYVQSTLFPLRVHYRLEEQLTLAAEVLWMAEESWAREEGMGFSRPLPDNGSGGSADLDIYLATEARTAGGAYTASTQVDTNPRDRIKACPAYVAVYEGLDPDLEMPVFVAHELNHAFQAAMDYTERTFIKEATAVAIEDLVYDSNNDYYSFIDDFQKTPWFSLNESEGGYPYGAALFAQFIEEVLGSGDGSALAELWVRTGQPQRSNEPDYLDAIGKMAGETGWGSLDAIFLTFTGWRYFIADLDDGAHFEEGAALPSKAKVAVTRALTSSELPATLYSPAETYAEPQDMGVNYYTLATSNLSNSTLSVSLAGDPATRWAIVSIRWYDDKAGVVATLGTSDGSGVASGTLTVNAADHVVLAAVNMGRTTWDADLEGLAADYVMTVALK